jgi:threonine dehydratase
MNPSLSDARNAQAVLRNYLPVSRLVRARALSTIASTEVYLKIESDLPTGSFKPRGALYALSLNIARRSIGEVTASSTGNHGAAVALAASLLRIPATIFLPANPNSVKRANIEALGARIVEVGGDDLSAGFEQANAYSHADGIYFLNDATDPDLPSGPATIALEIFDQLPSVDTIVVPMGDTALIRGVAAIAKQLSATIRIIGVQAERAPAYFLSWKQGRAVSTETCDTIADGLATRVTEADNVRAIRELVDEVVLVSDDEMLAAIRHLALDERVIAEPAGAAATAALLHARFQYGRHVVLLVTGANISPSVLRAAICGSATPQDNVRHCAPDVK